MLDLLDKANCLTINQSDNERAGQMGEMFDKALFGTVVQKTVEHSAQPFH